MAEERTIREEDYPSNEESPKKRKPSKPAKPRLESVVSGTATVRKKGFWRKLSDGADLKGVIEYIWWEIAVPSIKSTASDMVSNGFDRAIFGGSDYRSRNRSRNRRSFSERTTYEKMYSRRDRDRDRDSRRDERSMSRRGRMNHDFQEIVLGSRAEAEDIIDQLRERIEEFDVATVMDLYDAAGVTSDFTDERWGWTDLQDARVDRVRDGFLLDMPRPEPID